MAWLFAVVLALTACFTVVLLYGAPYLPTLSKQVETALDMLDLKPGDTMLELGCGDGKVLIAAAERGWNAVGYELNPVVAAVAWMRTRRCKTKVKVVCGNFWAIKLPPAEGIFVFLLDRFMPRLDANIARDSKKPVKLVSFAFQIPGKQPTLTKDGLHLYEYK